MPEKKHEELLTRKLNALAEKVREDIKKNLISEADGRKFIAKATTYTRHFSNSNINGSIAMRHIEVKYQNNSYDIIPDSMLNELVSSLKIKQFYRCSEERWVTIGVDRIRGTGGSYSGPERRVNPFPTTR